MGNISRTYEIKWQKDLALFIPIYNCFVLEGVVNDLYPVKQLGEHYDSYEEIEFLDEAKYSYFNLAYTIAELYKDRYCVVFFDHTKKQGTPDKTNTGNVEYGTFEFYDRENNRDNITLFNQLYTSEYIRQVEGTASNKIQNPLSRDMIRIRDAISMYENEVAKNDGKTYKPFLFVLKNVSRFMVTPGRTSTEEYPAFNIMFEISQMRDVSSKILLFVDKMNDLPTWFESENNNYRIKKLYVSSPDSDFKTKYYLNELYDHFEPDYSVLRLGEDFLDEHEFPELYEAWQEKRAEFDGDISKFNAFTEGFTVQTLQLFKLFLESTYEQKANLKEISSLVQRFKLGNQTNPWESPLLRSKINSKGVDGLVHQMKSNILGQDPVIEKVYQGLQHAVTGINRIKDNDRRPRAVFFLAGPTGTGKTEIAKLLARELFGSEDRMIRFDMSEFSAEHTDSRLFGAPPGYVGYEAGGELTQAIKQNPFSIILFDEIEKANGKILDKFLQILGDGRLTDGKGETVYFSDSIIIFTSNCGITGAGWPSEEFENRILDQLKRHEETGDTEAVLSLKVQSAMYSGIKAQSMEDGLFNQNGVFDAKLFYTYIKASVKSSVKAYFEQRLGRPELLGRIGEDNIVVYNFMTKETAPLVSNKTIKDFRSFLKRKYAIDLKLSPEVEKYILEKITSYDVLNLGARGIVMTTENMLKNPIADYLSNAELSVDSTVTLYMEDERIVCR